ncbi:MAG TPA: hydrogenase maturation nickel metallochaperone HypA [Syntrophales bacterium]|nr:hydrogenase maturation nickel metallochaperone HypA [Syntrophales bacterium]HPQ43017.1 hydrogenase maturation nickel metallochaperone HypA [Syntrophales bacterium]
MHELSLTQSILDIIEDYAQQHNFEKVNSVKLSFGRLSSIEPKALEFAFHVLSKETKAHGAHLEFDILPVVIYCMTCEKNVKVDSYTAICPQCAGDDVILTGGTEELKIVELDVD